LESKINLSAYNNSWYKSGRGKLVCVSWYIVNAIIFNSSYFPVNSVKVKLFRLFGASIGKGVIIKPKVNIKYPWKLIIGDYSWIGEGVWIDNLAKVTIEDNCCISQGALLLTGNHNFKKSSFDLMIGAIHLRSGSWVGAMSVVGPGVTLEENAILTVGSVASSDLDGNSIYRGNPAVFTKKRKISE